MYMENNTLWAEKNLTDLSKNLSLKEKNDNSDTTIGIKNPLIKNQCNDIGNVSGIYIILNKINNKWYVGSSGDILTPHTGRWYHHKHMLKTGKHHNEHLQNACNKYGEDCFEFHIVELINPNNLLEIEQKYLDYAKLHKDEVYNRTFIAGKIEMTLETKKKISDKAKERLKDKTKHPRYGKHLTDEHKKILSIKSPRTGKKNGMYGIRRCGKNNPNYKHGNRCGINDPP